MQIVVLADEAQKSEWTPSQTNGVIYITNEQSFLQYPTADAFIDLLYNDTGGRKELLARLLPKPVFINSVTNTLAETNPLFIRINGWPGFLAAPLQEAACLTNGGKNAAEAVFSFLQKKVEWLPDEPGFVTARVVSMIINEAYFALAEGVSTKEEIDTAMKLGTAYPYGPFEWAQKIGLTPIVGLLEKLCRNEPRYTPAPQLVAEAAATT